MKVRFRLPLFAAVAVLSAASAAGQPQASAVIDQQFTALGQALTVGASVYHLRNAAAADVAHAVNVEAARLKLNVTIVADPVSNTVLVSGAAGPREHVLKLLAGLDQAPQQILVQTLILKAPAGFAEDIGLGDRTKDESAWCLTPREVRMFGATLRTSKEKGQIEILSRPNLTVMDNQTGYVQVGDKANSITTRVTPRLKPDGTVLLRVEYQSTETAANGVVNAQSFESTISAPLSGTIAIRTVQSKPAQGPATEMLLLLTLDMVRP
jgi:type II secretory pathway component GspD/PulD (secretin)